MKEWNWKEGNACSVLPDLYYCRSDSFRRTYKADPYEAPRVLTQYGHDHAHPFNSVELNLIPIGLIQFLVQWMAYLHRVQSVCTIQKIDEPLHRSILCSVLGRSCHDKCCTEMFFCETFCSRNLISFSNREWGWRFLRRPSTDMATKN